MAPFSVILGLLCAFVGSLLFGFLAPFGVLSGYRKHSLPYLAAGGALLALAYGLGIALALLLGVVALFLAAFAAFYVLTIAGTRLLPRAGRTSVNGVTTIEDAVRACRASGLQGWGLVAYAQRLAAERFTYCRRNPWDSPSRAFERGRGYCQQQALALNEIYVQLGIDSRPMYALKCRFPPPEEADGSLALLLGNRWLRAWVKGQENVFGHTWLSVTVGDERLDVCPGDPNNRPGVVHFEPLSPVRALWPVLQPLMHLGPAMANLALDRQARRTGIAEI